MFNLITPNIAVADVCTDDYIISGGRVIPLLPDEPFEILETDTSLYVRRGKFLLEFINPKEIFEEGRKIKRYSLKFIGDIYYFDLSFPDEKNVKNWEQYADEKSKRGFGGLCK